VISTMAGIPDGARNRVVAEALIRNLHRFVKDVEPTNEEWESAMAFLVKLGQVCVWLVTVVVLVMVLVMIMIMMVIYDVCVLPTPRPPIVPTLCTAVDAVKLATGNCSRPCPSCTHAVELSGGVPAQWSAEPEKRHELMLVSDTLGVTMLVDCNDTADSSPTAGTAHAALPRCDGIG
jgi:hypothetical protein